MPAFQLEETLFRIGLALVAGVLICIVPLAYRKTRYEASRLKRILYYLVTLATLAAFCGYVWFLWNRFVPREAPAPAPAPVVVYPPPAPAETP